MKRILFIGDSHLARLEVTARRNGNLPFVADFIPAPGPIISMLSINNGNVTLLPCDENTFKNHPDSNKFDFSSWHKNVSTRVSSISDDGAISLNIYDAVVVVGGQLMLSEMWAEVRVAEKIGIYSSGFATCYYLEKINYTLAGGASIHLKILGQLCDAKNKKYKVFSVQSPLASEMSEFSKKISMKLPENFTKTHCDFLSGIKSICADFLYENYESTFIDYPNELITENQVSTKACFQFRENDFSHINDDACKIWFAHISNSVVKNLSDKMM